MFVINIELCVGFECVFVVVCVIELMYVKIIDEFGFFFVLVVIDGLL